MRVRIQPCNKDILTIGAIFTLIRLAALGTFPQGKALNKPQFTIL